jgi:hypothetical protein
MHLLERYLQAVSFFLPRRLQEDVIRELSDDLMSQIEEREQSLGRPLREDETADLLRRYGHPILVAGRYRRTQHLIGPVLFPLYVFALQAGLAVALLVTIVLGAVGAAMHDRAAPELLRAFLGFPGRALMVFAWTTLGFAALDMAQRHVKLTGTWDPRSLPRLARREDRMSRVQVLCELSFATAFVVWLLLIPGAPVLLLGPAASFLDLAPVWHTMYVPILGAAIAAVGVSAFDLLRPYWTRGRAALRIAVRLAHLAVFVVLSRAGEWVTLKPGSAPPYGDNITRVVDMINTAFDIGMTVAVIMTCIDIARELYRLWKHTATPSSSGPVGAVS